MIYQVISFYELTSKLWLPEHFHSFFGPYDYFIKASTLADEDPKMIILALGHCIIYEPIRNLIECTGNIGVMSKIC